MTVEPSIWYDFNFIFLFYHFNFMYKCIYVKDIKRAAAGENLF